MRKCVKKRERKREKKKEEMRRLFHPFKANAISEEAKIAHNKIPREQRCG